MGSRALQKGDCVYFKEAQLGTRKDSQRVQFKGHGFAMMLGIIPHFGKEPAPEDLFRIMGSIGFVTFDDVAELLGAEQGTLCVAKYEAKYALRPPTIAGEKAASDVASGALYKANEGSKIVVDGEQSS